jgi:hypothetical protein
MPQVESGAVLGGAGFGRFALDAMGGRVATSGGNGSGGGALRPSLVGPHSPPSAAVVLVFVVASSAPACSQVTQSGRRASMYSTRLQNSRYSGTLAMAFSYPPLE